ARALLRAAVCAIKRPAAALWVLCVLRLRRGLRLWRCLWLWRGFLEKSFFMFDFLLRGLAAAL
ncbi:hypothetical protein KJ835_04115, partial [Patescibacteria group bacterium]|nr:hypothetical protein [Patescibacteria group bacterium]